MTKSRTRKIVRGLLLGLLALATTAIMLAVIYFVWATADFNKDIQAVRNLCHEVKEADDRFETERLRSQDGIGFGCPVSYDFGGIFGNVYTAYISPDFAIYARNGWPNLESLLGTNPVEFEAILLRTDDVALTPLATYTISR